MTQDRRNSDPLDPEQSLLDPWELCSSGVYDPAPPRPERDPGEVRFEVDAPVFASNVATFAQNFMLAYLLLGATATRPTAWGIGLSLGSPTSVSGSEIASGSGVVRSTGAFSSVNVNTFVNTVANTYGPVNAAGSFSGIDVFDSLPASYTANQGDLLLYGLLATARTVGSGDSLVLASSALSVSLS